LKNERNEYPVEGHSRMISMSKRDAQRATQKGAHRDTHGGVSKEA
jgi:hypothetical protein